MTVRQRHKRWISSAIVFAIVWGLFVHVFHTHPASHAAQETSCAVCSAQLDRIATPPKMPRLLPPAEQILFLNRADAVSVVSATFAAAYRSRAPPAV